MSRYSRLRSSSFIILILLLTFCISIQQYSNIEASNADIEALVDGNTEFAIALYNELRTTEGNVFLSPYSISTALAMTYGGAREETAKQMAETLHFSLVNNKIHSAFSDIQSQLNKIQLKGDIQLNIANSLWPQEKYAFLEEYRALTRRYYGTEITPVDYERNPEGAQEAINVWVEEKTNNKIKDIISQTPSPLTRLILVNAIYFKGNWDRKFRKSATQKMHFYLNETESIEVPMMKNKGGFNYGEDNRLQVLELPYAKKRVSMFVFLPRTINGLRGLERILTKDSLEAWIGSMSRESVEVYLPRFRMTAEFSLHEKLKSMGMIDAFDENRANFSGMDGNPNWLYIGAVLHKTFIEMNEKGTEAAAATGVELMLLGGWPPPPKIFQADHPFLFLIRDNSTGSILFMGRVSSP